MSKSYWGDMDKKARGKRPKFNFAVFILIIIVCFAACFGVYMLNANRQDVPDLPSVTTLPSSSISETTAPPETTVETTTTTEATTAAPVSPVPISAISGDMSYFDDCVFIGDSITSGFSSYGIIPEKNVYASIGMNIDKINTEPISVMLPDANDSTVYSIQQMTIIEALKISKPPKIYIMLGSNGIAWLSNEHMIGRYKAFVDSIKTELPDAKIYILSIPPVTAGREDPNNSNGQILNSSIDSYNSALLQFANENSLYYVDINTSLKGNDGKLPAEWSSRDGMHFNKDTYNIVINYILSHIAEE